MADKETSSHTAAWLHGAPVAVLAGRASLSRPCPVCRRGEADRLYGLAAAPWELVRCRGCGLGFLDPMPGPEDISSFYPEEYYGGEGRKFSPLVEALVRVVGDRHVSFLARGLPAGAPVLDVGCGRGVLLGALAARGFEAHGLEVSAAAARGADPRAEIRIRRRLAEAGYPADKFAQVIFWHVLEHLPDPREALLEARRILRPGGRLVVAVPNFSSLQARWAGAAWFHLDLPRHLCHFPISLLCKLMGETGFELRAVHHFSLRQNPFGWLQSALNRLPGLPRNGLYALLHRRVPGEPPPFRPVTRAILRAAMVLGCLPALGLAGAGAILRRGGTVHAVAVRRG